MKRVMLMWLLMLSVSFVACSEGGPEEEPTPKPEIDYTEDITAHIDANFAKELQRHKLIVGDVHAGHAIGYGNLISLRITEHERNRVTAWPQRKVDFLGYNGISIRRFFFYQLIQRVRFQLQECKVSIRSCL